MAAPDTDHALTTQSVVVASKEQVSSDLAGEAIVLSLRTGLYYGLADVGLRIWELVREPIRVAEVCGVIVREYEVAAERCEHDVLELLSDLAKHELIDVCDESRPPQ